MNSIPVFAPVSPQAQAITELFVMLLIICAGIFALVSFLVVYSLVRFRARPERSEPRQTTGNKRLELAWTGLPFLLLVFIFVMTARAMSRSDPLPQGKEPDLVVIAHQWWWEVRYPNGIVTANQIHIPIRRPLLVQLEAADVIHDFWAPALARKMDMIPMHPNHIWLQADKAGVYFGFCAEYCGLQHAGMRFRVVAQEGTDYQAWQDAQLRPPTAPSSAQTRRGQQLFRQFTCANCHVIGMQTPGPKAAPDLTHLASRDMLAGELLANTPDNLKRWLVDPQLFKPGCLMPTLRLSEENATALAAYLQALK